MMNTDGCVGGGLFSFPKYDIGELSVGLVHFFNKKMITIVLKPQLHN